MSPLWSRSTQLVFGVLLTSLVAVSAAAGASAVAPPLVSPVASYSDCGWLTEDGKTAYVQRLSDFNPADLSKPLPQPTQPRSVTAVVCGRNSILPDLSDYRILSDLKLPLFIQDGTRTVALESNGDNLSIGLAAGPILSPAELNTASEQLGLLRPLFVAAKAAAPPPAPPPEVDLTSAYTPADLAVLLHVIDSAGVPQNLGGIALQMGGKDLFSGCPFGAQGKFTKALAGHLESEKGALQNEVAARFEPAFTHDELATLDHYFQMVPLTVSTEGGAKPRTNKLTPDQATEVGVLANSPIVRRFMTELPINITPVFERLADLGTVSLEETCPAHKPGAFPNPTAPVGVKYHPLSPFQPQSWTFKSAT